MTRLTWICGVGVWCAAQACLAGLLSVAEAETCDGAFENHCSYPTEADSMNCMSAGSSDCSGEFASGYRPPAYCDAAEEIRFYCAGFRGDGCTSSCQPCLYNPACGASDNVCACAGDPDCCPCPSGSSPDCPLGCEQDNRCLPGCGAFDPDCTIPSTLLLSAVFQIAPGVFSVQWEDASEQEAETQIFVAREGTAPVLRGTVTGHANYGVVSIPGDARVGNVGWQDQGTGIFPVGNWLFYAQELGDGGTAPPSNTMRVDAVTIPYRGYSGDAIRTMVAEIPFLIREDPINRAIRDYYYAPENIDDLVYPLENNVLGTAAVDITLAALARTDATIALDLDVQTSGRAMYGSETWPLNFNGRLRVFLRLVRDGSGTWRARVSFRDEDVFDRLEGIGVPPWLRPIVEAVLASRLPNLEPNEISSRFPIHIASTTVALSSVRGWIDPPVFQFTPGRIELDVTGRIALNYQIDGGVQRSYSQSLPLSVRYEPLVQNNTLRMRMDSLAVRGNEIPATDPLVQTLLTVIQDFILHGPLYDVPVSDNLVFGNMQPMPSAAWYVGAQPARVDVMDGYLQAIIRLFQASSPPRMLVTPSLVSDWNRPQINFYSNVDFNGFAVRCTNLHGDDYGVAGYSYNQHEEMYQLSLPRIESTAYQGSWQLDRTTDRPWCCRGIVDTGRLYYNVLSTTGRTEPCDFASHFFPGT